MEEKNKFVNREIYHLKQLNKCFRDKIKILYEAIIDYIVNTMHCDKKTAEILFNNNYIDGCNAIIYQTLLDIEKLKGE